MVKYLLININVSRRNGGKCKNDQNLSANPSVAVLCNFRHHPRLSLPEVLARLRCGGAFQNGDRESMSHHVM